jgi:sugar phosphate isomerase/epimerase
MKLSCTLWLSHPGLSFAKSAELLSEAGYDAIEIPAALQANPEKIKGDEIEHIKAILERNNLGVSAFCLMYPKDFRHASPLAAERTRSIEYTKRLIDLASEVGAGILVWGSGYARNIPAEISKEVGMKWLLELLEQAAAYAMERHVKIVIEPLNRYESTVINTVHDAVEMASRIGSPALRALCDTFHMNVEEASLRDSIIEAGAMLAHVHVSDSNRAIPGMGHIDFRQVFEGLRRVGYDGYITLEALLGTDVSRDLVAARRYLKQFVDERSVDRGQHNLDSSLLLHHIEAFLPLRYGECMCNKRLGAQFS